MWSWIKRWFSPQQAEETYALGDVFTPSQPARLAFVRRPDQESDLRSALGAPGTQALIYGESGAGKSSMALRVLGDIGRKYVVTRCEAASTYAGILASAFAQTNATRLDRASSAQRDSFRGGGRIGGGESIPVQAGFEAGRETESARDYVPVAPTAITAESLAVHLGSNEIVWLIEDFHKVSDSVRISLADALKIFSDESLDHPKTTVIILGAADSAADVLATPSNMRGRLATISLPPLADEQLGKILDQGGALLNVDFSGVREQIIRHSVGVASVTHALAYECCRAAGVMATQSEPTIVDHDHLTGAKSAYVRTRAADMKVDFDRALTVERTRRYHNYAIILKALAALPESGGTHAEILSVIRREHRDYPSSNLTLYLRKLQTDARGNLVRRTAQGTFRYDKPLQHAYAILRFGLQPHGDVGFWAANLDVSENERQEAARLAGFEDVGAPDGDDDD